MELKKKMLRNGVDFFSGRSTDGEMNRVDMVVKHLCGDAPKVECCVLFSVCLAHAHMHARAPPHARVTSHLHARI